VPHTVRKGGEQGKMSPTQQRQNLGDFLRLIKAVTMVSQRQKTQSGLKNRGNQKGKRLRVWRFKGENVGCIGYNYTAEKGGAIKKNQCQSYN